MSIAHSFLAGNFRFDFEYLDKLSIDMKGTPEGSEHRYTASPAKVDTRVTES